MVENTDPQAEVIEELAAQEHNRWSRWHRWLETLASPVDVETWVPEWGSRETRRVGYLLPAADFDRWSRQADTDYTELSPEEQELDRAEVRELVELLMPLEGLETAQGGPERGPEASPELQAFRDRLEALFAGMVDLLVSKRQAYGSNNLIRHGHRGIIVRMSDKIDRLDNLTEANQATAADGESITDAYRDLIGYAALGLLLWDDDHAKPSDFTVTVDFGPIMQAFSGLADLIGIMPTGAYKQAIESASEQEQAETEHALTLDARRIDDAAWSERMKRN